MSIVEEVYCPTDMEMARQKSGGDFFRRFSLLKIRSLGLSPLLLEVRNSELKNL